MTADDPAEELAFPYLRRRGRIALIGVNSAVPTPPGIAQGEVGAAQRAALGVLLRKTGAEGLCRVVMIHHPPLASQAPLRRRLRDSAALVDVLKGQGAELVLHGHNHIDEFAILETATGRALIVGVGSSSAVRTHRREPAARAALYRISLHGAGEWSIEVNRLGLAGDGHAVSVIDQRTVDLAGSPSHAT
jgi:3',5'-cyclic AMP phosphodiesterase CpdA